MVKEKKNPSAAALEQKCFIFHYFTKRVSGLRSACPHCTRFSGDRSYGKKLELSLFRGEDQSSLAMIKSQPVYHCKWVCHDRYFIFICALSISNFLAHCHQQCVTELRFQDIVVKMQLLLADDLTFSFPQLLPSTELTVGRSNPLF